MRGSSPENQPNYTIKAAAVRVGRSTRTVKQWIRDGLRCREVAGMIVINHTDLMAQLRAKSLSNPSRKRADNTP